MSIIPTTFSPGPLEYAVIGGGLPAQDAASVSAVVLNRGGRAFNRGIFDLLDRLRFASVLCIDHADEGLDAESLALRHPRLRLLILKDRVSGGEMVNLGIAESWGEFVLVLSNDMEPELPLMDAEFVERLRSRKALCVAPALSGPEGELLPSVVVPAFERGGKLKFLHVAPSADAEECLFPPDYCGFYSRDRFILSGGYDPTISNPWWQKADFGFRARLWGERIKVDHLARAVCRQCASPEEDSSADESYERFFLKNLAVRKRQDQGVLPLAAFLPWALRSSQDAFRAWTAFGEAREWVRVNRYRFLSDAAAAVDLWGREG